MIHTMKLQEQYFNYIKYGTKEYEIRLNEEKSFCKTLINWYKPNHGKLPTNVYK